MNHRFSSPRRATLSCACMHTFFHTPPLSKLCPGPQSGHGPISSQDARKQPLPLSLPHCKVQATPGEGCFPGLSWGLKVSIVLQKLAPVALALCSGGEVRAVSPWLPVGWLVPSPEPRGLPTIIGSLLILTVRDCQLLVNCW